MFTMVSISMPLLIALNFVYIGECANILAVFPHGGKSHFYVMEPYLKKLASRGHHVTVVSNFPQPNPVPNYVDVDVGMTRARPSVDVVDLQTLDEEEGTQLASAKFLAILGATSCDRVLELPQVRQLSNRTQYRFDLVIAEIFNADCFLAIAHIQKAPIILLSSCTLPPWASARVGLVDNPSYIPVDFLPHSDVMGFPERLYNTVSYVMHAIHYPFWFDTPSTEIARKHLGQDLPPVDVIARNTSLILVNTHFSFTRPRPLVPGVVEVAGIHLPPVRHLPKDIQEFLDGAEHGAIYFSMGSMIKAETFPDDKRDAFLQAFAELPQRVLWKWEGDHLPGQPKNVKVGKWLPQFDILNHPKIRVFLAHGGLLGTIETVHCGIPMVAIPMYGDQSTNVKLVETAGMAIKLNYHDITKDNVLKALRTILNDPSYTENAKRVSRIFRDRPMSPMDTAIYWTEYVIRHHGAPHMRTAGADLPLYQYLLLDVIATILAVVFIVVFLMYLMLKKLFRLLCSRKQKPKRE